jgi:phosphoribosylanthranilate isomerase
MEQTVDQSSSCWPRIQAAGISTLSEALFCLKTGILGLGFTLELPSGIHDGLTNDVAKDIISHLPTNCLPIIITYLDQASEAAHLVKYVRARAIQFHGGITAREFERFQSMCPNVKKVGCINIEDEHSLGRITEFNPNDWNAIILDSSDPSTGKTGATGMIHNWDYSSEIVKRSSIPIILAGGLNWRNVGDAIRKVKPACVDAHTGLESESGRRDLMKIERFAFEAHQAFRAIFSSHPPSPLG